VYLYKFLLTNNMHADTELLLCDEGSGKCKCRWREVARREFCQQSVETVFSKTAWLINYRWFVLCYYASSSK